MPSTLKFFASWMTHIYIYICTVSNIRCILGLLEGRVCAGVQVVFSFEWGQDTASSKFFAGLPSDPLLKV